MRESVKDHGRLKHMLMPIDIVFDLLIGKNYENLEDDKLLFFWCREKY